jgi:uncharacterized protein
MGLFCCDNTNRMNPIEPPCNHIDAGPFGAWLAQAREALRGRGGMNVPCGDCVGCCTSHYAILLRPHDVALDLVPAALQSSVPGMWYPHAQMKPRSNGHCAMFNEGRCSIYSQRPQTCLDYDCRVFAATGLAAGADKPVINQRIQAWQFSYEDEPARQLHKATLAASAFLQTHADEFPQGWLPTSPLGMAGLAIKVQELFVGQTELRNAKRLAAAIVATSKAFDANSAA